MSTLMTDVSQCFDLLMCIICIYLTVLLHCFDGQQVCKIDKDRDWVHMNSANTLTLISLTNTNSCSAQLCCRTGTSARLIIWPIQTVAEDFYYGQ